MKQCPYCGNEITDDKSTIYCIKCDHIIDDEFFLRQKLKKEVEKMQPAKTKPAAKKNHAQPHAPVNTHRRDHYVPKKYQEEKKSYANIILITIVVIIVLYMFFK